MYRLFGISLLLPLLACNGKVEDTDTDTDTDTETDTDQAYLDEDEDGFTSDVDCNDNDYAINPNATEVCDEVDNNCDGDIDEGFDLDEDGFVSQIDCNGDDCNDDDDSVFPGATEVPYDGIDQDCNGQDLNDVDMDGYIATEAGGDDCLDSNPDVNPGATEVPKDMIDNDCADGDSLDGDGDGHDDEELGGDDCDDTNPEIYPGHVDWFNDGIDSDCDTADADEMDLYDAPVTIVGDTGMQDLLGFAVVTCDLDEDGTKDLIVSAPFSDGYQGRVGIFYGSNAELWTTDMAISDADAVITGSRAMFFGMGAKCGDFDGDGHADLAIARGEINYAATYVTQFELVLFYGDGTAYSGAMTDSDGDVRLERELGVDAEVPSVVSTSISIVDLDSDGADEIGVSISSDFTTSGENEFLFMAGGRYTGVLSFDKSASWVFSDDDGDGDVSSQIGLSMVGDLDGDGTPEIFINQMAFSSDPDATDPPSEGRIAILNAPVAGIYDVSVEEYGNILGTNDATLGAVIVADFDGDGADDALLSGPRYGGSVDTELQGILYYVSDIATALSASASLDDLVAMDLATSHLLGYDANSLFGYKMEVTGDLNGDGYLDVLVREPFLVETRDSAGTLLSSTTEDTIWILSGAELVTPSASMLSINDVRIQEFEYDLDGAETGSSLNSSDIDGDGSEDVVIAAYGYPDAATGLTPEGKVYVYLSTSLGW